MSNPAAGQTPTYHLRWPGGPDLAEGPTGFKNLATDTEAALAAQVNANSAWLTAAGTLLTTGSYIPNISAGALGSIGTTFVANTATTIKCANPGLYLLHWSSSCSNTGAIATGTSLDVWMDNNGSGFIKRTFPMFGTAAITLWSLGTARFVMDATFNMRLTNNNTAQSENIGAGNVYLFRISD